MGILEKNIEMMNTILNKELETDISPEQQGKGAVFDIGEHCLSDGETVSLKIFVSRMHVSISTFLGSADKDSILAVEEFIAAFNMQRSIVKCGIFKEKFCVKTDIFIHSDNKHEEERLTRAVKAHLTALNSIVKKIGELTRNDSKQENTPEKPKKTKFDFSLFDES